MSALEQPEPINTEPLEASDNLCLDSQESLEALDRLFSDPSLNERTDDLLSLSQELLNYTKRATPGEGKQDFHKALTIAYRAINFLVTRTENLSDVDSDELSKILELSKQLLKIASTENWDPQKQSSLLLRSEQLLAFYDPFDLNAAEAIIPLIEELNPAPKHLLDSEPNSCLVGFSPQSSFCEMAISDIIYVKSFLLTFQRELMPDLAISRDGENERIRFQDGHVLSRNGEPVGCYELGPLGNGLVNVFLHFTRGDRPTIVNT